MKSWIKTIIFLATTAVLITGLILGAPYIKEFLNLASNESADVHYSSNVTIGLPTSGDGSGDSDDEGTEDGDSDGSGDSGDGDAEDGGGDAGGDDMDDETCSSWCTAESAYYDFGYAASQEDCEKIAPYWHDNGCCCIDTDVDIGSEYVDITVDGEYRWCYDADGGDAYSISYCIDSIDDIPAWDNCEDTFTVGEQRCLAVDAYCSIQHVLCPSNVCTNGACE